SEVLSDGWHHVILSYDDPIISLYVDGILVDTKSLAGWTQPSGKNTYISRIGNAYQNAIDEVRIYSKALNQAEVSYLYRNPAGIQATPLAPAPPPEPSGLVLYWPLDETEGTIAHDICGNYDGTITVDSGAGWGDGKVGGAFNFNEDIIESATAGAELDSGSWTISAWIKADTLPSVVGGAGFIVLKSNASASLWDILLYVSSSDIIAVGRYNSSGVLKGASSGNVIETGKYYWVAATWNGTWLSIYVNGLLVTQTDYSGESWRDSGNYFKVGATVAGSVNHFEGSIDEVRMCDVCLDPAQMLALYQIPAIDSGAVIHGVRLAEKAVDHRKIDPSSFMKLNNGEADLVGHWSLDGYSDDEALTIPDHSGNGHDGTLTIGSGAFEPGAAGNGIHCDGSATFVDIADDADFRLGTGDFTIALWINSDDTPSGVEYAFSLRGSAAYTGVFVLCHTDGKWYGYLGDTSSAWKTVATESAPSTGAFHFLVFTRQSGTLFLYLDGELQDSNSDGSYSIDGATLGIHIGKNTQADNYYLDGIVDEPRFYSRALSLYEILFLYFSPAGNIPHMLGADRIVARTISAAKIVAADIFLQHAIGSQPNETPSVGDVRGYFEPSLPGLNFDRYVTTDTWTNILSLFEDADAEFINAYLSGEIQANQSVYSLPGVLWRDVPNPFNSSTNIYATEYGNSVFVMGGGTGGTGEMARSTDDGETWGSTLSHPFGSNSIIGIAYGNSVFVAVAAGGSNISRSTDYGATWSSLLTTPFGGSATQSIAYGNSVFVAGTGDGKIARSIDNGATWGSTITNPFGSSHIRQIAYGGGVFVAVADGGKIARSTDGGASWGSLLTTPFGTSNIYVVEYGDGVFLAGAAGGKAARSVDGGATWGSLLTLPFGSSDVVGSGFGGHVFLLATGDNKVSTSSDFGVTWGDIATFPLDGSYNLYDIKYSSASRKFVSGCANGSILLSDIAQAGAGLIENGLTLNGTFIKFSNGMMFQWGEFSVSAAIGTSFMG
ncbi:MAG: hypothetical protein JRI22_22720, partial [Deltaproteobacteria bacterium]|nr:hypothetical protein [Deltaproteobacteria bacterium]